MTNPIIKTQIVKAGNSYAIRLPKALIDMELFELGEDVEVILKKREQKALKTNDSSRATEATSPQLNLARGIDIEKVFSDLSQQGFPKISIYQRHAQGNIYQ